MAIVSFAADDGQSHAQATLARLDSVHPHRPQPVQLPRPFCALGGVDAAAKNLGINDGQAEGKTVKAAKRPFVCDILSRNSRISVVVSGRPQIGGTARNTAEAASLPAHFL